MNVNAQGEADELVLRSSRQFVVALALGDAVLANLVQQCLVADLQQGSCLLSIPVGFLECLRDGLSLGFIFGTAGQRLQTAGLIAR